MLKQEEMLCWGKKKLDDWLQGRNFGGWQVEKNWFGLFPLFLLKTDDYKVFIGTHKVPIDRLFKLLYLRFARCEMGGGGRDPQGANQLRVRGRSWESKALIFLHSQLSISVSQAFSALILILAHLGFECLSRRWEHYLLVYRRTARLTPNVDPLSEIGVWFDSSGWMRSFEKRPTSNQSDLSMRRR